MSEQPKIMTRPRAPRRDKGHPQWTPRDLEALAWIADQYGVRRDQLAVLLARWATAPTRTPGRLAESTVKDWVERWRRAGVIESTQVLSWQHSWVWLTRLGLEHLELDYRLWEPKSRGLPHLYAINEARLLVEARYPEAEWHSERALRSGQPFVAGQTAASHQPDAEVLLGERRVAIEVEVSSKSKKRQPAILYQLARHYDGIWYFCPPTTQALMQRAIAELNPPAVRQKFSVIPLRLEGQHIRRPTDSPPHPHRNAQTRRDANTRGRPTRCERTRTNRRARAPRCQAKCSASRREPACHPTQCFLERSSRKRFRPGYARRRIERRTRRRSPKEGEAKKPGL